MKSRRLKACILFIFAATLLAGCNRSSGGGISAGAGGLPQFPSTSTPAEVSTSDQVVRVSTQYMPGSSSTSADIVLIISPGFHINANPATYPYLIATEVQHGQAEGVEVLDKDILYPRAVQKKFAFEERPLAIYEGQVVINLPLKLSPTATGQRELPVKVRVQACDHEKCFPPATIEKSLKIDLDLPRFR